MSCRKLLPLSFLDIGISPANFLTSFGTVRWIRMQPLMDHVLEVFIEDLTEDGRYRVIERLRPPGKAGKVKV